MEWCVWLMLWLPGGAIVVKRGWSLHSGPQSVLDARIFVAFGHMFLEHQAMQGQW
jgi:hypothetical protein